MDLSSVWRQQQQGSLIKPLHCRGNKKSFQSAPSWLTSHQATNQSKQAQQTLCRAEITWCGGLSRGSLLRLEPVLLCASGAFSITDIWRFHQQKYHHFPFLSFPAILQDIELPFGKGKKPSLQIKWPTGKTHFPQEQSNSRCNLIRWYKTLSVLSLLTYLCDWQLQLNDILRLGHRGLQRRVQEQDAVQILPTSHCIVVHKQHLVHCREVLASDATAGLGCGTNTPSTKCSDGKGQATSTEATAHQVKMQNQLNLPRSVIWCQSWHYGCMINTKHQITYKGWTIMENNHWLTHWQRYSCYKEPYLKGSRSLLANTTSTVVILCASVVTWLLSFAKQGGLFFYCMSLHPSSSLLALCHAARKSSG